MTKQKEPIKVVLFRAIDELRMSIAGNQMKQALNQHYIFNAILQAAYIVTASDLMRQHILDHYHVRPEKIVRNYYGHTEHFHLQSEEVRRKPYTCNTREVTFTDRRFRINWIALHSLDLQRNAAQQSR